ncbi:MAG TPA: AMP-binding protein, partial [Solirubrobacteraceae bacterium]|nr:AMP-binding protein [Solirubrobacteraceae bacterium]
MSLARLLTDAAAEHGERTAVKLDDNELNYQLLDEGAARVAGLLAANGIEAGDRVGIMLPNVPYFPVVYYGVLRAGGVVVPMNPLLKGREVAFHLQDSGAKVIFVWGDMAQAAEEGGQEAGADVVSIEPGEFEELLGQQEPNREVVDRGDEDTAVILYTSGTTGTPKGAELTHANLKRNIEVSTSLFDMSCEDVVFGGLPFFHSFGQTCALNATVSRGATITLLPRFEPDHAFEIIQRDKVTILEGVPTMYSALLNHPGADQVDTTSLRVCVSGGSPLPGEVLRGFEDKFGAAILEGYGLSETSPVASFNHPDRERKVGSIGTPIEGVHMMVVDDEGNELPQGEVGEIAIK